MDEQNNATALPGDELVGTTLGERYKVLKRLSQGGMGVVFLGRHVVLDNLLAIKVLLRQRNEIDQQRFLLEAKLASKINHPNTVNIVDFGCLSDGRSYLVMEYLQGDTLADVIKRGRLTPQLACRITAQIARGLQAVHDKGIIHRDLKPANVVLLQHSGKPDFVKILDFGIAKETAQSAALAKADSATPDGAQQSDGSTLPHDLTAQTGGLLGTPSYVSPEQAEELPVDARSDQYSLGCILFEMLTAERPYTDPTQFGLLMKHIKDPVPSPAARAPAAKIPAPIDALVKQLLAKQPAQRFPSMKAVAEVCERLGSPRRLPLWGAIAMSAALAVLLGSSGYLGYLLHVRGRPDPRQLRPGELAQLQNAAREILRKDLPQSAGSLRLHTVGGLGQIRDGLQHAMLLPLLRDRDDVVAAKAAEALGQLGEAQAVAPLLQLLSESPNATVRLSAARGLQQLGAPQGEAYLLRTLDDTTAETRLRAAFLLCDGGNPKVRSLLEQAVAQALFPESVTLEILACLSQGMDGTEAREKLRGLLHSAGPRRQKIPVAAHLAQLGEHEGKELLRTLSQRPSPEQLLAARALAAPEEPSTATLFRKILKEGAERAELAARLLCTEGLADSGELFDVRLLGLQLNDRAIELRLAAAISVLQLAGNDPSTLSAQGLSWARGALGAGDFALREAAVSVLADSTARDAVQLLTRMLADSDTRVRRGAIIALGHRVDRAALVALQPLLKDPDPALRREVLHSIERIALALQQHGDRQVAAQVHTWLAELRASPVAKDSILASVVLLHLGDETQREHLRAFQSSPDEETRRFLIEVVKPEKSWLLSALSDSGATVRFAAAQLLAKRGDRAALPVLREALERGGTDGIIAHALLRHLGEHVTAPKELAAALRPPTPLAQRRAAIAAVADLPAEQAVPLLREAARDPDSILRRSVVEAAAALPTDSRGAPGLPVLRILVHDSDPAVRARAAVLQARLLEATDPRAEKTAATILTPPGRTADSAAVASTPPGMAPASTPVDGGSADTTSRAPDIGQPASGSGTLMIDTQEGVQFQLDHRAWESWNGKPLRLAAGPHRLSSLGGTQDIVIEDNKTLTTSLQPSVVEELLRRGTEAYHKKEYGKAQKLFERASAHCSSGRRHAQACARLGRELLLQRGRLFEDQKLWAEAMTEYEKLDDPSSGKGRSPQQAEAQQAMARLAPRLGKVVLRRLEGSGCKEDIVWMMPGTKSLRVDGKQQTIRVRAREVLSLGQCEN